MKLNSSIVVVAIGLIVLSIAGVSIGQLGGLRPAQENTLRLAPGESVLVHDSTDTVIEIYIELPITAEERIQYHDVDLGAAHLLPNGAWIRAQGRVVLSRDPAPAGTNIPQIRWRYVDSIFRSFSRDVRGR